MKTKEYNTLSLQAAEKSGRKTLVTLDALTYAIYSNTYYTKLILLPHAADLRNIFMLR